MSEEEQQLEGGAEGSDAFGVARLARTAGWHTATWTLQASLHASRRLARAALSPSEALALARDLAHLSRVIAHELGAVPGIDDSPRSDPQRNGEGEKQRSLREEGELLLQRSRDVRYEFEMHPAYERILGELAPDEARILRLLLLEGPQPSVDVRTGGPLGMVRSRLIASGLSMIGARAGCRYVERIPSYLNNLFRLGLIWFSRETLREAHRYQVLEAQPDVLEAIHSVPQAKVVRRSIHLTPFGEDFCRIALCPEEARSDGFPAHAAPEATYSAEGVGEEPDG